MRELVRQAIVFVGCLFMALLTLALISVLMLQLRRFIYSLEGSGPEVLAWIGRDWGGMAAAFIMMVVFRFLHVLFLISVKKDNRLSRMDLVFLSLSLAAVYVTGFAFLLSCVVNLIIFAKA